METIPNACGSDSVITLTLKVLPACAPTAYAYTDSIVLGETYLLGCQTITPTQVGTADYVETIPNACGSDSVITLTLKVLPACPDPITVPLLDTVICAADTATFMWQGRHFNVDGEYYDTVRYVGKDCDSAYFSLRLKINMTTVAPIESDTICGGDSYDWVGHTGYNDLTETGVYKDTLRYPNGCDSIYFTLHLTVLTAIDAPMDTKTICAGDSYDWPEHPSFTNLTVDSTYRDTLKYKGTVCDSIRYTLRLKVQTAVAADAETATFCAGDSYNWVGHAAYANLTEEGVYKDTARYTTGCDSVYYQLTLTKQSPVTADAEEATICAGDSYEWVGHAAYANLTEEGVYKDTVRYTTGCDSVYYMLKLIVQSPVTADVETVTICAGDSYDWVGHTGYNDLTNEGTYKDTARYTTGCDSVYYQLTLTVNPSYSDITDARTVCGSELPYTWNGIQFDTPGTKTATLPTILGCDSVITMTLDTFIFDLPANISVDDVVAICGKAIDVTEAQQQVEAHIQSTTGYAPNATVAWYQLQGGLWVAMSTTAIEPGKDEITLRYAITSDCGTIYSANLIIPVQTPSADNIPEMDNLPALEKYGDRLLMIHRRRIRETYGFDPTPEQVTWYKVTGAVDTLGKITDDTEIGHGYYYTADAVLRGEFYAVIEETPAPTSCGAIYRTERIICEPEDAPARVRKVCQDERLYIIVTDENGRETIYDATGRLVESLHAQ